MLRATLTHTNMCTESQFSSVQTDSALSVPQSGFWWILAHQKFHLRSTWLLIPKRETHSSKEKCVCRKWSPECQLLFVCSCRCYLLIFHKNSPAKYEKVFLKTVHKNRDAKKLSRQRSKHAGFLHDFLITAFWYFLPCRTHSACLDCLLVFEVLFSCFPKASN